MGHSASQDTTWRDAELREETVGPEVIDGAQTVNVRRQTWVLPATADVPPLGVERTVPMDGPTRRAVVLIHGLAQNRVTWRVAGRSWSAALAHQGFEVLNLELRGHGNSRRAGAGNAASFEEYVRDVRRVVDPCAAPPFVIGHSLGGGVGVGVATEVPLAGLVHWAGVFTFGRHNRTLRTLGRLSLKLERRLLHPSIALRTGWFGEVLGQLYGISDVAGFGFPLAGWVPGSMEPELLRERLAEGFDWTSLEIWLQLSRWATGEPFAYASAFAQTDVPLLVLAGDHDPLVPPPDARACFDVSGSQDKRFVEFNAFDHGVNWGHLDLILGKDAPRIVWPHVLEWLTRRDEAPASTPSR